MNCKNCGHNIEGQFCGNCGQSSKVDRLNLPSFLSEMTESIFQINRGFFFTLKELFVRPGYSLREFLNGKRKNHFKPVAYVLTLSTFYFLISHITDRNTWMDDMIMGWMSRENEAELEAEIPALFTLFAKNYAYSTLILLPAFSLASYLSFLKFKTNYLEHLVINSYITGQQALFYTLFMILAVISKSDAIESIPILMAILYTCWVYWQFFSQGNRANNILRSLLCYALYITFAFTLFMVMIGIIENAN